MARLGAIRHALLVASGFTLVEIVITVAIVAILASAAVPLGELAVTRSREQDLRRNLREIREALDAHKQAWDEGRIARQPGDSGYPKSLDVLVKGVDDIKDPKKAKIYFLRRVPGDPFASDPGVSTAASWGRRSYSSPPDDPREGDDVFDVFSLAAGKGLNGRPYREW